MQALLTVGVLNAVAATVVAVGVLAIAAVWRNPFVNRGLWLAVLLKFVIPPLVLLPLVEWPPSEPAPPPAIVYVESSPAPLAPTSGAPRVSEVAASPGSATPLLPLGSTIELPTASTETSLAPTSEAIPSPAPQPSIALQTSWEQAIDLATVLWLAGALAFSCIALLRVIRFHRALTRAALASDDIQRRAAELAGQAGMSAAPVVRITLSRTPPLAWRMAYGATILLPAELVERLPAPQLDAILAHELTHLRRGDDRYRWLEFVIVTAFWWCPSAWFARRRLHEAEERCCDADVLHAFPALASHYASALLAALDGLAPAPRHVVGTPFFNRGSLVRRFEMITASRRPRRPSRAMNGLLAAAGVALLVVTPIAASAEGDAEVESPAPSSAPSTTDSLRTDRYSLQPAGESASEAPGVAVELDQTLTVRLPDGKTRQGRIVFDDQGVPELLWDAANPSSEEARPTSPAVEPGLEMWDVSFDECLALIIKNNRLGFVTTEEFHVLRFAPKPSATITLEDASTGLTNQFRDVQDAYWELWYCYKHLDAAKGGRDLALETWRRVKTLQRAGSVGGEDNAEAESRAHYYLLRARVEVARSDLFRVENRLRYLLGLAVEDGRLIRPIDEPSASAIKLDAKQLQDEAMSSRIEMIILRKELAKVESMRAGADISSSAPGRTTLKADPRVAAAALEEVKLKVEDAKREIVRQLRDAIRDVELNHSMVETNRNRRDAARDEVAAVGTLYEVGQITLDRVLLAQIRQADAESAYARSLADYVRAIQRIHYRTGATITEAGYRIEPPAATEATEETVGMDAPSPTPGRYVIR